MAINKRSIQIIEQHGERCWDAYDQGRLAFAQGVPRNANPWTAPLDTHVAHWDWNRGWEFWDWNRGWDFWDWNRGWDFEADRPA